MRLPDDVKTLRAKQDYLFRLIRERNTQLNATFLRLHPQFFVVNTTTGNAEALNVIKIDFAIREIVARRPSEESIQLLMLDYEIPVGPADLYISFSPIKAKLLATGCGSVFFLDEASLEAKKEMLLSSHRRGRCAVCGGYLYNYASSHILGTSACHICANDFTRSNFDERMRHPFEDLPTPTF